MGCYKFAMPLLSTLAALVIIVHTAEENYEQDYRDLRSKSSDVDSPHFEQPWRNMQALPLTQSPIISQGDVWDESNPDPPLRRRRPGRKRKRRPIESQEEDLITQERYISPDSSRPRRQENMETPRRRRKKIYEDSREGSRWNDERVEHRRRRGQKRKRPKTDTMPELSEFNDYRQYEREKSEEAIDNTETRIDNTHYNNHNLNKDKKKNGEIEFDNREHDTEFIDITTMRVIEDENEEGDTVQTNGDSLSEFSSEVVVPGLGINRSQIEMRDKIKEKNLSTYKDEIVNKAKTMQILIDSKFGLSKSLAVEKCLEKIKIVIKRATKYDPSILPFEEEFPLDPQTLKSILKRSNGKSLSEILQQNNLTLADLLRGKEKALSILQNGEFESNQNSNPNKISDYAFTVRSLDNLNRQEANKNEYHLNDHKSIDIETTTLDSTPIDYGHENIITRRGESALREQLEVSSEDPKGTKTFIRRRFPVGIRRKIRLRSMTNNTYKGQLNRDLIAQSSIKYKNNRNVSRPRDWKEFMPSRVKTEQIKTQPIIEKDSQSENIIITTYTPQESTTQEIFETTTDPTSLNDNTEMPILNEMDTESKTLNISGPNNFIESIQITTEAVEVIENENIVVTETSTTPQIKSTVNASDFRRQAFKNRLKRKRLRYKFSTTELPDNLSLQQVFGESNFVSASEFITKSQTKTSNSNEDDEFSTLEDFFTTESYQNARKGHKTKMLTSTRNNVAFTTPSTISTEEIAKIEIEEILNDSLTNEKLTKILKERNMTLNELVAHRERGSSHLHLADIFHNASREPNPPEPFLTKSLIEPISKETYPLRALLEANLHDTKTTTIDPNTPNNLNIPVVMNFGNNVNEIGENMGIVGLFNKFSKLENNTIDENDKINEHNSISNSDAKRSNTTRDGRSFNGEDDSITWNDLITIMQKNNQDNNDVNKTLTIEMLPTTFTKTTTEDDTDDDGLTIFEDLQLLKNMDNKIDSDELLEINLYERNESPLKPDVIANPASNTKSVTVATISIIGLALILFLLTYAATKWKQQSDMFQKKHSAEEVSVPSPIFENRKTQKLNSSTRSMSPMLTTNIYAVDSLETRDGSESPEYMWDTLRKPYQ